MPITPNSGTGPGAITNDGSPVEFYLQLPARDEARIVGLATPAGGTILELGCGVGRVTHALVEHGYRVTAVDESAEMLAHVRGAETIQARIQELDLGRCFDTVLLASYLINTADNALGQAFLAACARHVSPDGSVLIQWQPTDAHDRWEVGQERDDGEISIRVSELERLSPELLSVTSRYTWGEKVWTQSFVSRRLTDEEMTAELGRAKLTLDRFLTEDKTWFRATK